MKKFAKFIWKAIRVIVTIIVYALIIPVTVFNIICVAANVGLILLGEWVSIGENSFYKKIFKEIKTKINK
jgi:flagellar biosynthesis protein FliQ